MKKILIVILISSFFPHSSHSQVIAQDSLALVDLYYYTLGSNWNHNDNWLTGPVASWAGIWLNSGNTRVKMILLGNNNLTGNLPSSIGNLTALTDLDLSFNNFEGNLSPYIGTITSLEWLGVDMNHFDGQLPLSLGNLNNLKYIYLTNNEFSGPFPDTMRKSSNEIINIDDNHFSYFPDYSSINIGNLMLGHNSLTFEHLEPNIQFIYPSPILYSPQDSVRNGMDTTVVLGNSLVLGSKVGGTANQYLWFKDGTGVPGATDTTLALSNINYADSGYYTCNITNTLLPGLTLNRRMIHVRVSDSANPVVSVMSPPRDKIDILWDAGTRELRLDFQFPQRTRVKAILYNAQGQFIRNLIQGEFAYHHLSYDLSILSPGLYLVKVEAGKRVESRKIVIR